MSNGSGRGGNTSKRSPPRRPEDWDATITLRSTRGTGLPPRILSSGRGKAGPGIGRGGLRATDLRDHPTVRPTSGSVPPWAYRSEPADTTLPSNPKMGDETTGRQRFEKEPPTQPKWDREKSRTPLPPPRMMPSSPPSAPHNALGASLGYSAGPSHQHWMSPHDQAGPSKYSVNEPTEERDPVIPSAASTPSTNRTQFQLNPIRQADQADEMHKSAQLDLVTTSSEPARRSPEPQSSTHVENGNTTLDEKEDAYADSPGAGPSRVAEPARVAEAAVEKDIKPDLSALMAEEIPTILDEDREDGVLAINRNLVLQCYEKNPRVRSAARKAFRVQKTAELSAVGRIVQHVLWRDDGVGVQWVKARKSKSPTKAATTVPSKPITAGTSPPKRPVIPPPTIEPTPAQRPKTPPLVIKPEPSSTTSTPMLNQPIHHSLPPRPTTNPPPPITQPAAGPSRTSPVKPAPTLVSGESPALSKKQKKQLRAEEEADSNKRKAGDESSAHSPNKPAKLPKINQTAATGTVDGQILNNKERKAVNREIKEDIATNGSASTSAIPKKKGKKKGAKWRAAKEVRVANAKGAKHGGLDNRPESEGNAKPGTGVLTSTNAIRLPQNSKLASTPNQGIGKETDREAIKDKGKGKVRQIVDLSDDIVVDVRKGASKDNPMDVVDLTRESKAVNAKSGPSAAPKSTHSPTKKGAAPPSGPSASIPKGPSNPLAAGKATAKSTSASITVRPTQPSGTIPKPSAPPARPSVPTGPSVRPRPPSTHALGLSTIPSRPPASNTLTTRPTSTNSAIARPPPPSSTMPRPPPLNTMPRPPAPSGPVPRPPPPSKITVRIPSSDNASTGRPAPQPQYQNQNQAAQSSYSERQALAALARPPLPGTLARPAVTKFTPRPTAPPAPGRPAVSARPPTTGRPVTASAGPSMNGTSALSSSSPMASATDMLPSRSLTPAIVTPRYTELRRLLSDKMEEMDNWTSMLVDLPDRAEMTQRQIDRTRQECFDLQKQMREEKEKTRT